MVDVSWDVLYNKRETGWSGGDTAISERVIDVIISRQVVAAQVTAGTVRSFIDWLRLWLNTSIYEFPLERGMYSPVNCSASYS